MKKLPLVLTCLIAGVLVGLIFARFGKTDAPSVERLSVRDNVVRSGVLRCGYVNWKPYYYTELKDGNTQPTGLNYDIMMELGKVLDLKIDWVEEIGWGNIGEGFKTNRYDAVCTSAWIDAPKLKNLLLSRPIFYSAPQLYVRADDNRFDGNPERLNQPDVTFVVIDGAPLSPLVAEQFPSSKITALPQLVQSAEYLMTVITKKADVATMDPDEIKPFMAANPGKLRAVSGVRPLRILPHILALPPSDPQFMAMMNAGLQVLIDNGVMEKIRKKYDTGYFVPAPSFRE